MASLLVYARGSRKGDIADIRANDSVYGQKERPPYMVRADIPSVTMSQVIQYLGAWVVTPDWGVIGHDPATDRYRLRIFSDLISPSGIGGFAWADVSEFVTEWGGALVSEGAGEVVIDIHVFDAVASPRFWQVGLSGVTFTEQQYSRDTGIHVIEADYSLRGINPTAVETRAMQRGLTVVSNAGRVITFEADVSVLRGPFFEDLQHNRRKFPARSRYRFTDEAVDAVLAAGGTMTVTAEQAINNLVDKAAT